MRKKALFVALIWISVAVIVLILYWLREVSPVKEFIAWVLTMWPLLAAIGTIALIISGWVIKHNFGHSRTIIEENQDIKQAQPEYIETKQNPVKVEAELKKPKPFDVECQTATMSLPINLQKDGTWKASAAGISPSGIFIIHRGDIITVTRVTVSPEVLFTYMDGSGWETTSAITVTPQRPLPALLSPYGAGDFEWDVTNPLQWVLTGLPLTMGKDQYLPLPGVQISVKDANLVGAHFTKFDWCKVVIRLTIRTDKGSPYVPDLFIELTSSDIPNLNPRYYWKDVTNESKD